MGTVALTQRRLRRGLGGCWEICFALFQHISAPLRLPKTLSDSSNEKCDRGIGASGGLVRFPRFRANVLLLTDVAQSVKARNSRKRTNYAIFTGQPLAGALFRLPATVDKVRMIPGFFATGKTLRRAPARQRLSGRLKRSNTTQLSNLSDEHPHVSIGQTPSRAGARLCVSLAARGQGNMRALLTVARNRKSAPARGWNGKMALLGRFLLVSAASERHLTSIPNHCRNLRKSTKRWKADMRVKNEK